jgi:formylglycine-generating enzyme
MIRTAWVALVLLAGLQSGCRPARHDAAHGLPSGMALIPAGAFKMGDSLDGDSDAVPIINVNVSAFYMDVNLVSFSQWQSVYYWATSSGYGFDNIGAGKAANHPVQTVNWFDTVKWCNARSQQTDLTPVYYTDAELTQVYTNGETANVFVNWTANGYRLPTEAEWEKAARGGLIGKRYPWGDTISESKANYQGNPNWLGYDSGPDGFNAAYETGEKPFTSPVGSFAANGYGLYDMAGNVGEWCWDWYGRKYAKGSDPRGPASGDKRVMRGGFWYGYAHCARCYNRSSSDPKSASNCIGFRCARGL